MSLNVHAYVVIDTKAIEFKTRVLCHFPTHSPFLGMSGRNKSNTVPSSTNFRKVKLMCFFFRKDNFDPTQIFESMDATNESLDAQDDSGTAAKGTNGVGKIIGE